MLVAGLVKSGGLMRSPPGPASIWPMFSPELKPVNNAVLEAVVGACAASGAGSQQQAGGNERVLQRRIGVERSGDRSGPRISLLGNCIA